jgi:pyrimidine operon attenuation protein / uracil phosphoribosyltransferase
VSGPLPDPEALVTALADAMRGRLSPDAGLVGIYTGGAWVAERLHRALGLAVPLGLIAVTLHRDDFRRIGLHREPAARRSPSPSTGARWCSWTTCSSPAARCAPR